MKKSFVIAAGLMAAFGMAAVYAQSGSTAKSNKVVLENCLISAYDQAQVPAREAGVLMAFEKDAAREGTEVTEGTVLAHLDNRDLLAKKESAELEIEVAE